MDFSPQTVRSAGFKTVKKGYDPGEVDDFKEKVAAAIETAQNQATAMEARARAAVAKLQEVSQQVTSGTAAPGGSLSASDEDAETISRTLLLAQRTADNTVSQANSEAEAITVKARVDATTVIDNARSMADKFKEGQPVIMNLEASDREVSRRLIDFASGLCYGLNGTMEKVATGVYLLKPIPPRKGGYDGGDFES